MALVTVELLRYSKTAVEVGNQYFHHHQHLLVGNSVGLWPLGKIVHSDEEVWVPLVTSMAIILNWAPTPGLQASGGCTGLTALAPFLNIRYCLKPVIPLSDLVQGLVNTQVSSLGSTMGFSQYFFHFTLRDDYLSYFRSPTGGLLVAVQYTNPYCE
jgi:hypothetical protein